MERSLGAAPKAGQSSSAGGGAGPSGSLPGGPASAPTSNINYTRDRSTVNQTPSTPLLFSPVDALDIPPDVPPPSYEEATGIAPSAAPRISPGAPALGVRPNSTGSALPPLPARASAGATLAVPGAPAANRRASAGASPNAGSGAPALMPARRHNGVGAGAAASGVYGNAKGSGPRPAHGGPAGAGGRTPAPGSVPRGRQFPPAFNLYGDNWARTYTLGEHQQTPLYAVRMRPTWQIANPVIALHNGPNAETAPLLAAVDYLPMSDSMAVTLPPPLTYTGSGSTAVRLDMVLGWSHHYAFTMEVGTDPRNVHNEAFQWRHSYGMAVAALGGMREGWKLVRMSTTPLPGGAPRPAPASGFLSSDGREVVAMYTDARMSLTKQLKFAFVGTGLTGALGERWAVMAVTSALAIWEKEEALQNRR